MRRLWYLGTPSVLLAIAVVLSLAAPAAAPPMLMYSAPCTTAVTITTTTEAVLCTVSVSTAGTSQVVRLWGMAQVTVGTGGTALTFRWRRGSTITGTLVGVATAVQVTAGNTVQLAHAAEDTGFEFTLQPYALTVQQTAATGNGSGVFSELIAIVF